MKLIQALKLPSFFKKTVWRWFKLPYVSVSSTEEYFSLPKNQREKFGLYLIPFALPWEIFKDVSQKEGWDYFYSKIKEQYPLQWFIRRWLPSLDNPVVSVAYKYIIWPYTDIKYSIKRWFNPLHPRWRASLPRHQYKDIQELVVDSNFALIRDFYWEEVIDGVVDWSSTEEYETFHNQLVINVNWIENELPALNKQHEESLSKAFLNTKAEYYTKYEEVAKIEKEIHDKTTEILTWFIENRAFFWT
jgi:hypothetical protein